MKIRNTFILIVVLIALSLYMYRVEVVGVREKEEATELSNKVMPYEPESVKMVRVGTEEGVVVCTRENAGWRISEPVETKGDKNEIDGLLTNLTQTSVEREFEEEHQDLSSYGLVDPGVTVQVSGDGFSSDTLSIGRKTPTKTFVYARRSGNPRVFLLPQVVLSQCEKSLFDLRNKMVLGVDKEDVGKFTIRGEHGTITCEKRGENWFVVEPVEDMADNGAVSRVLSSVAAGKAVGFESEKASDLSAYGLKDPAVTIDVFTGADMQKHTLLIGDKDERTIYAKDAARDPIFKVNNVFHESLNQEVKDFRNKKVLDFVRSEITSFEIKTADEIVFCEKDTASGWYVMKAPGPSKFPARPNKVNQLLSALSTLRVEEFADDNPGDLSVYGLDHPRLEIAVSAGGEEIARVLFGDSKEDKAFAKLASRKPVYLVRGKSVDNLTLNYEDLLEEEVKDEGGASAD